MDEQQAARILDEALNARRGRADGAASGEADELLSLAAVLRAELAPASPSRAAVARTRARVLNRVGAAKPAQRASRPAQRPRLFRRFAFAVASLLLVFAILASGTGVAYAAGGSLPGDSLYGLKLGFESTRLALTLSPTARGAYLRDLADERLSEIQTLLSDGRDGDLPAAFESYNHTLDQLEQASGGQDQPNLEQTRARLEHHLQVLQSLLATAPPAAVTGLENAVSKSHQRIDVIDALEQGVSPSDLAPGQLKKTPSPGVESGGKGPSSDHTPGPPGGPPGQNKDGGNSNSNGQGKGKSGDAPGQNK